MNFTFSAAWSSFLKEADQAGKEVQRTAMEFCETAKQTFAPINAKTESSGDIEADLAQIIEQAKKVTSTIGHEVEKGVAELSAQVAESNRQVEANFSQLGERFKATAFKVEQQIQQTALTGCADLRAAATDLEQTVDKSTTDGAAAIFHSLAAGACGLNSAQITEEKRRIAKELEEVLGDDARQLLEILESAKPQISAAIIAAAESEKLPAAVKKFIREQLEKGALLDSVIEILLPRTLLNIVKLRREMAANNGELLPKEHLLIASLDHLIGLSCRHFEAVEKKIESLGPALNEGESRREEIEKLFAPAVEELLAIGLPGGAADLLLEPILQDFAWGQLRNILSKGLYTLYATAIKLNIKSQREALKESPHSQLQIALAALAGQTMGSKLPLLLASQNDNLAKVLLSSLNSEPSLFVHQQWLAAMLNRLFTSEGRGIGKIWELIGKKTELLVENLLTNLTLTAQGAEGEQGAADPTAGPVRLVDLLQKHQQQLRALEASISGSPSDQQLQPLCQNFFGELCSAVAIKSELRPLLAPLENALVKKMIALYRAEEKTLATIMAQRELLSPSLAHSCRSIAERAVDEAYSQLGKNKDLWAHSLHDIIIDQLKNLSGDEANTVASYLQQHDEELKKNLACEFDPSDQDNASLLPFFKPLLAKKVEGALLGHFAQNVERRRNSEEVEKEQKKLANSAAGIIEVVATYIDKLKSTKKKRSGIFSQAYREQKAIAEEKSALNEQLRIIQSEKRKAHPDLDLLAAARAQVRAIKKSVDERQTSLAKLRLEKCDGEMAKKLLAAIGLTSPTELNLPAPLSTEIWASLNENVVPHLFSTAYRIAADPAMINELVLAAMESYDEISQAIEKGKFQLPDGGDLARDPEQQRLNKACGELALALVQSTSNKLFTFPLQSDAIRNRVAMMMGAAIRQRCNQINNGLIEKLLESNLHPLCKKNDSGISAVAQNTLATQQTAPAEEESDIAKMVADEKIKKALRKKISNAIAHQVKVRLGIVRIARLWKNFQKTLNRTIRNLTGDRGMLVKNALDTIFRAIFFSFLGAILLYPFRKAFALGKQKTDDRVGKLLDAVVVDDKLAFKLLNQGLMHLAQHKSASPSENVAPNKNNGG